MRVARRAVGSTRNGAVKYNEQRFSNSLVQRRRSHSVSKIKVNPAVLTCDLKVSESCTDRQTAEEEVCSRLDSLAAAGPV